jgi:hypothetical protein
MIHLPALANSMADDAIERAYREGGARNDRPVIPAQFIAYVEILTTPDPRLVGKVFALDREHLLVGRFDFSHIYLVVRGDAHMSRGNTIFSFVAGRFEVANGHSTHGTSLNGRRLADGESCPLTVGDIIDVGGQPRPDGELFGHARLLFRGRAAP